MDDAGLEHAAILLMAVGEEEAAEVFKYLSPKEVQKLGETMARLRTVPREKIDDVVGRFHATKEGQYSLVRDTDAFISQVLKKALGEDKASMLLDRILQGRDVSGIESLKWMDPATIAELLKNEHPQIVASILVHLERHPAAGIAGTERSAVQDPGRQREAEEGHARRHQGHRRVAELPGQYDGVGGGRIDPGA